LKPALLSEKEKESLALLLSFTIYICCQPTFLHLTHSPWCFHISDFWL